MQRDYTALYEKRIEKRLGPAEVDVSEEPEELPGDSIYPPSPYRGTMGHLPDPEGFQTTN